VTARAPFREVWILRQRLRRPFSRTCCGSSFVLAALALLLLVGGDDTINEQQQLVFAGRNRQAVIFSARPVFPIRP
jgi:hypothetical protein